MSATALVIGGSGGIGQAIVRRLAADGEQVTFTYLRAERSAHGLVEELDGKVRSEQLDVRDTDAMAETVGRCGDGLRTVVFAAASGVHRPLHAVKAKHVDWTFDVSARSFVLLYGQVLEPLGRNGGSLTTLSSVGSRRVLHDYALVGMAKAAMESTVRYAAVEGAGHGVRVNCVCAGVVETRAISSFADHEARLKSAAVQTPLGRLATPDEVADAVAWLAGPQAAMVTGQILVVDGGFEIVQTRPS